MDPLCVARRPASRAALSSLPQAGVQPDAHTVGYQKAQRSKNDPLIDGYNAAAPLAAADLRRYATIL